MRSADRTLIILSPGFPANESDSTCMPFPQLFVKTLKKENPSLKIIVLAFQYPFSNTVYNLHGVIVIPFNGKEKGKLNRLLVWRRVWRQINIIMKDNDVSGILSFWLGECALIGKYVAKKFGKRNFTWLLGQDAKLNNRYFSLIKPSADSLIALSDSLSDNFYTNYKIRPQHTIIPGIDINQFTAINVERSIDLLGVGSLIALKQFDVFIHVVAAIALTRPGVKAVICGKGPEKNRLVSMIKKAGLENNIELTDELDHQEVLNLMQRSKILLHTSSYEGFATVYGEALYAGAQVVGFCKPMNVIFRHQHVVSSKAEMIDKVIEILSLPEQDNSRVLINSIEETCKQLYSLYTQ